MVLQLPRHTVPYWFWALSYLSSDKVMLDSRVIKVRKHNQRWDEINNAFMRWYEMHVQHFWITLTWSQGSVPITCHRGKYEVTGDREVESARIKSSTLHLIISHCFQLETFRRKSQYRQISAKDTNSDSSEGHCHAHELLKLYSLVRFFLAAGDNNPHSVPEGLRAVTLVV